MNTTFACRQDNDLFRVVSDSGYSCARYDTAQQAIDRAPEGSAVLVLADGYPGQRTKIAPSVYEAAQEKKLRLYVEYPDAVPGLTIGAPRGTEWERAVVASDQLGDKLPRNHILSISGCTYTPVDAKDSMLVIARVAGFDTAVFGIPDSASPLLFRLPDRDVILATTKLSGFVRGRYAPAADWTALWQSILRMLDPGCSPTLRWTPEVRPAYGPDEKLPADFERRAFSHAIRYYLNSRLLVNDKEKAAIDKALLAGDETRPVPAKHTAGDGSDGVLEGYAAGIDHEGNQRQRIPIRDDCNGEVAMALAVDSALTGNRHTGEIASNLLRFIYVSSGMCGGVRGNPKHPAFGLMAWGAVAPAWTIANYGDDNARAILGTLIAQACLGKDEWDPYVMRALLANLRTTGKLGFREDRVDIAPLEQHGWRPYFEAENVNYSPHMDSYLWACNLWAYKHTGYRPFLDSTRNAIKMTMAAFPTGWRWNDANERCRMLLCLAWLIRIQDTPEHRGWLKTITDDLISHQQSCGAIPELLGGTGGGHYHLPGSNEQYGVMETPLIQQNGDPVTDQLYTTGFALLGLHEAAAATGDPKLKHAEDRLAEYLCRIQTYSTSLPYLSGTWFRAFDYRRWDYWASSADIGWGAWSAESGWGPAWITAVLGLREKNTNVWDLTAGSGIAHTSSDAHKLMLENDGSPWKP